MAVAVATGGFAAVEMKNMLLYGGPCTADPLWARFAWFIGVVVPVFWGGRYVFARLKGRGRVAK